MRSTKEHDDIVTRFIELVRESRPDIPDSILDKLEADIRQKHAGKKYYILKRIEKINLSNLNLLTAQEIQKKFGVSRAHAYRLRCEASKKEVKK